MTASNVSIANGCQRGSVCWARLLAASLGSMILLAWAQGTGMGQLFEVPSKKTLWSQNAVPPEPLPGQPRDAPTLPGPAPHPSDWNSPYGQLPAPPPDGADNCPDCGSPWPGAVPQAGHLGERLREGLLRLIEPDARYRGPGRPLLRESWRYRPFSAGCFMGVVQGDTLINDWVGQKQGYLGGYRLGWDFHHYWGCEMRLAWGHVEVYDSQRAKDAQKAADDARGLAPDDPFRQRFDVLRHSDLAPVWDFSLLYYPWGDAAWRPYLLAGLGFVRIDVLDRLSQYHEVGTLGIPLGVGVKYRWKEWLALRFELTDNIAWAHQGINTVHELSATGGVEIRFGGTRKAYWPWNPGLHYW